MTDRYAAAIFALLLTCFTVWLCFRGIAWVVRHGWRSMLDLRGRAVVEWQDQDVKDEDFGALAEILQNACDEEPDPTAEHFQLWHAELSGEKQIARALRRMDRWSR